MKFFPKKSFYKRNHYICSMKKKPIFFFLLSPFSLIFGLVAALRRKLFRPKIVSITTICVGNLRMGGTGKTPLVEYIVTLLAQNHKVAILSRGYGRKTKGYISAHETQNLNINKQIPYNLIIGDEPLQYATKFPNVDVAVCENRKTGIEKLLQKNPKLEVVVLDDAYQYLSVNYSLRILLTEYNRPFFDDYPIPSGRLREFCCASKHADTIIVSKCPENLTSEEKTEFIKKLKPKPHQEVFFTKINYELNNSQFSILNSQFSILLITGIDNPTPLVQYIKTQFEDVHTLHFPDHHPFTNRDIDNIIRLKEKLGGKKCTIITTEKDAMRLQIFENMPEFFTIPIKISFLENETGFKEKLLSLLLHNDA